MLHHPLQLDAYLARINYKGPLSPTLETLRGLHRAQVMSIPFENLNMFLGLPIQLDPDSLIHKLVDQQRGGYCHELNGLFLLVLQHLGFTVTSLAARVFNGEALSQLSHQLTLVEIEGKHWLADVGFGGNGLIEPIPLEVDRSFPQQLDTFRLQADDKLHFMLQHRLADHWHNLYAFSLEPYYPADYQMMSYYTSTSPTSSFTQHIICTLTTDDTRIILYDDELKRRGSGETVTMRLADKGTYRETLQRSFGIVIPPGTHLQSPYALFNMLL